MRNKLPTAPIIVVILLLVVATVGCRSTKYVYLPGPDAPSPEQLYAEATEHQAIHDALTLEQILENARLAANDITSYKTTGTSYFRSSTDELGDPTHDFSEIGSQGDYRFGTNYPESDGGGQSEWRKVGGQVFSFHDDDGWEEATEPRQSIPGERTATDLASYRFLDELSAENLKLRSVNQATSKDGMHVYRLEYTETHEQPNGGGYEIKTLTTTLLISEETSRIVTSFRDSRAEIYDVSTREEIDSDTRYWWYENLYTTHFYDFNEPVVIVIPDSYVPWSEPIVSVN
jgi:hypothetical protein